MDLTSLIRRKKFDKIMVFIGGFLIGYFGADYISNCKID